jgi:hypothetical protein
MSEPATMRNGAELAERVQRAITAANGEPDRKDAMICWLAEVAATLLALEIRGEQSAHDADRQDLADCYRDAQALALDPSAHWTVRREALRNGIEYQRAKIRIREGLATYLKGAEDKAA